MEQMCAFVHLVLLTTHVMLLLAFAIEIRVKMEELVYMECIHIHLHLPSRLYRQQLSVITASLSLARMEESVQVESIIIFVPALLVTLAAIVVPSLITAYPNPAKMEESV